MTSLETMRSIDEGKPLPAGAASPVWFVVINFIVVVGGIGLRWAQLGKMSLWFDEGYTAWVVSNPVREIIRIIEVDTAPPLYYILLRGWVCLFGFSEAALRSMSALMASIALLLFFVIARRVLQSRLAVTFAVCLFSFSFMQIGYAHEARFYAMMTMMGAIDFYLVLLVCERSTMTRLTTLAIAWSISLYTNNMMAVYLACLGLAWLVLPGAKSVAGRIKDAAIVSATAAIAFAPWLPVMLAQTKRLQHEFWPAKPDRDMLTHTIGMLAGVHNQSFFHGSMQGYLPLDLLLVGLCCLLVVHSATRRRAAALVAFGIAPIIVIFIYSRVSTSIFMERAFLVSGIALPLLITLGIQRQSKLIRNVSAACVIIFLFLCLRSIPKHRLGENSEPWRAACAFAVDSKASHRLAVCVSSDGETLCRYYAFNRDYGPRSDVTAVPASFFAMDPPRTMRRVKSDSDLNGLRNSIARGNFDEVVLIASHTWWGDPNGTTRALLSEKLSLVESKTFQLVTVYRFKPK